MDFYHSRENIKKQLLDIGVDSLKTVTKKVVQKSCEFLGNKTAGTVTQSNHDKIVKLEPAEEIIIPPGKRKEISNDLRQHYQISRLLNDSIVSKFLTKKWIQVNDLSGGQYSVNKNLRFKTSMLGTVLCDYNDAYIVVKGTIMIKKLILR